MTRRGGMTRSNAHPNRSSFDTPDTAATASSLTDRSFSTSRESKGKSGARTSLPSSVSTPRPRRSSGHSDSRSQPTLTQIDFVTRTQEPGSDNDRLNHIELDGGSKNAETRHPKEVITIEDDGEDDGVYGPGVDRRSLPAASRRARTVRFEPVDLDEDLDGSAPKRRRMSYAGNNERLKNATSTGKKKNPITSTKDRKKGKSPKFTAKKDKTLTQMRFVQRIITIDSDDEDLEYTHSAPKTQNLSDASDARPETQKEESRQSEPPADVECNVKQTSAVSELLRLPEDTTSKAQMRSPELPATPRKSRDAEIPSSQSPESPSLAPVSSPPVPGAVRSPLKCLSPNFRSRDSPGKSATRWSSKSLRQAELPAESDTNELTCPVATKSPTRLGSGSDDIFTENGLVRSEQEFEPEAHDKAISKVTGTEQVPAATQRTVVYETDAETEYSDIDDEWGQDPAHANDFREEGLQDQLEEDSQELPPPPDPPSEIDHDTGADPSDTLPPSEASICYQRLQPATQFPLDPVPRLNTQRMAELFPSQNSPRRTETTETPLGPPATPRRQASRPDATNPPKLHEAPLQLQLQLQLQTQNPGQTQTQTETQTQSQDSSHPTTEVVPESSPILQHTENDDTNSAMLPPGTHHRQSVVQVESSQPADRLLRRTYSDQSSGPRGILSKSQLLTSSLMESVPLVPFWLGSQDSVGEPYSMPDG